MVKSFSRGHEIYWDGERWWYADDGTIYNDKRPCKRCGRHPTPEGYDACVGARTWSHERVLWAWSGGTLHQMAVRIRRDGRIYCAALRPAEPGDTYIDDELHYQLSVIKRVLVTEPCDKHMKNAEWWWVGNVPDGVEIEIW